MLCGSVEDAADVADKKLCGSSRVDAYAEGGTCGDNLTYDTTNRVMKTPDGVIHSPATKRKTTDKKEREKRKEEVQIALKTGKPIPDHRLPGDDCANDFFVNGLSDYQSELIKKFANPILGQKHLFEVWEKQPPSIRRAVCEQLEQIDKSYSNGGIVGYIQVAKDLLKKSAKGENPLEGWTPSVPTGAAFDYGSKDYRDCEKIGIPELSNVGFVLVAGGLGERLGYKGIKLELPVEMATERCYLQHYIEYIQACKQKYSPRFSELPLCIMVSKDTVEGTTKLLREKNCFGMPYDQIEIVQQGGGVPAIIDNDAKLAIDKDREPFLMMKPHGHGDIHELLYKSGVTEKWAKRGIKWIVFFQDTNGLAFHTLPLMLGVSRKYDLIMNSLAVPRKAKQAIGGIAKLTMNDPKKGMKERSITLNVEYNQLDPLLRAVPDLYPKGDVNDPETGFSPFPGNINQLLFKCKDYSNILQRTKGTMRSFVNPKYADESKTTFKKPTRLECMMQDFPTVLNDRESSKVGFTGVGAEMCFAPVKNANPDGAKLQKNHTEPGTAATGEAAQYASYRKMLAVRGCLIETSDKKEIYNDIKVKLDPMVVFKPSFITCPYEMKTRFPYPEKIKISKRSTLIVSGAHVVIESLTLDGALVIEPKDPEEKITIKDMEVFNEGWERQSIEDIKDENEQDSLSVFEKMRGYRIIKKETKIITSQNAEETCNIQ